MSKKHNTASFIGKKYNKITVLAFSQVKQFQHKDRLRNKYYYTCLCECGSYTEIASSCLKTTQSCGCARLEGYKISALKQKGTVRPSIQKPNGESVLHAVFLSYKNGAKKRNIAFNISKQFFAVLTSRNCKYCDTKPSLIKKNKKDSVFRYMNGIDRVDSSIGYTEDNCVPCCKVCNYMKHEMSISEWESQMTKIMCFFFNKRLEQQ